MRVCVFLPHFTIEKPQHSRKIVWQPQRTENQRKTLDRLNKLIRYYREVPLAQWNANITHEYYIKFDTVVKDRLYSAHVRTTTTTTVTNSEFILLPNLNGNAHTDLHIKSVS